jgi:hypothetical protein
MPVLALNALLSGILPGAPSRLLPFRDVAMVRHWEDVVVDVAAFEAVPRVGADRKERRTPVHDIAPDGAGATSRLTDREDADVGGGR